MRKSFIVIIACILLVSFCFAIGTFAWLGLDQNTIVTHISGRLVTEYFHCGSGTANDPFVITRPIHYYHMVEFFQRLTNLPVVIHSEEDVTIVKFGEEYLYFQIGCPEAQLYNPELRPETDENTEYYVFKYDSYGILETETIDGVERGVKSPDLNMAYYSGDLSIMPIGSSQVPFVGQLDGKGLTVSNLSVITSSWVDVHTYDVDGNVTGTNRVERKTCDVGIFGYIGSSGVPNGESEPVATTIKNVYFDNVTIDLSGLDKTAITSVVDGQEHNTTIHDGDTCYAGYIAGHISLASQVQDVYVNNSTFIGGDAATIGFGYFGCVENLNGNPVTTLGSEVATLRTRGDDAGFGGSIDMYSTFQRLMSMFNEVRNTTPQYVTSEVVVIDKVPGGSENKVAESQTKSNVTNNNGVSYRYYVSPVGGGILNFPSDNSTSESGSGNVYECLYGESTIYTKTRTTYTYENDFSEAFFIHDGDRYLSVSGTSLSSVTSQNDAAKWLVDAQGHIYTLIDISGGAITKYYLNRNGSAGVTIGTSASTIWNMAHNSSDSYTSDLYLTDQGVNYYLDYNSGWVLTRYNEYYTISDGQGHYISANTTSVQNVNSAAASIKWFVSDTNGSTTTISAEFNGTVRYLDGSSGVLTMSGSSATWNRDGNKYYVTLSGIRYYLIFDFSDNNWKVLPVSGKRISDGSGHYLTADTNGVSNSVEASAIVWQFSSDNGNTQIYTILNGQVYYLTVNNGSLGVSTTAITWNRNGNSFYLTLGGKDYYLNYDGSIWTINSLEYFTIHDGNGNYLRVTGANSFANSNSSTATHFYFETEAGASSSGKVYCVFNGNTYYLRNNGGVLETANQANGTAWSNDGSSLYVSSGNTTYALEYSSNWHIKTIIAGYYITDGTNYMTVSGTTIGNTTNIDDATVFTFSTTGANPQGTIQVVGTSYYLRNNNGTLQISTTSTSWTNNGTRLYSGNGNNTRYLGYYNGEWRLSNATTQSNTIGHTISYTRNNRTYYLNATSVSGVGTGTSVADLNSNGHTVWFSTNDATDYGSGNAPNGYIYTIINGTQYYLYRNSTTTFILSSNNRTKWYNYEDNNLYERLGSNNYYNINCNYNSSSWNITSGNTYTQLNLTAITETITITSRANVVDTTHPVVRVSSETTIAPIVTINNFVTSGTEIAISDSQSEEVTFEKTSQQTVLKTIATGVASGNPTYFPIRVDKNDNGSFPSGYPVSPKNTGYIVSGAHLQQSSVTATEQKKWGDIRVSGFTIDSIEGSYSTTGLTVSKIRQGNNYLYLQKQEDNTYIIANTTSDNQANFWEYSGNKLRTTIGKTTYYLTYSGGLTLTTNSNSAVQWTFSNNNRLAYSNNYIRYNNGWTTTTTANQGDLTLTLGTLDLNKIYTYDASGNHVLTANQKTDAFKQAALQLSQTLVTSSTRVFGLHFMDAQISKDHLIKAETASIFGQNYTDYELPEDSIDFNVIERGSINFFAGEYFSSNGNTNDAFFSLHKVFRYNENDPEVIAGTKKVNDIKDIKEITDVYKNDSLGDRGNYIFKFTDGTYTDEDGKYTGSRDLASGYTSTFNTSWIKNPSGLSTSNNRIYYFEIPCNEGEYCLGSVAGKTGAYLIYLDIAANGGDTIASAISSEGNDVANTFSVEFRDDPDKMDHSVLMFSIDVPDNAQDKVSVKTYFDKTATDSPHQNGLYTIEIINKSNEDLTLYVYLCDDDYNLMTQFQYAYQVKYTNNDQTNQYVTTAVGSVFQMMAGFTIPKSGAAQEITYHQ